MGKRAIASALLAAAAVSSVDAGFDPGRFYIGTMCIATNAQTEAHFRDLRDCGIDYVLGLRRGSDEKFDLCMKYGIDVIEHMLARWWTVPNSKYAEALAAHRDDHHKEIDKIVRKGLHPAIKMGSVGDEPSALRYDMLAESVAEFNERLPATPAFLNLNPCYGRLAESKDKLAESQLGTVTYYDYIDQYCRKVPTDHVSADVYPIPQRKTPESIRLFWLWYVESCSTIGDACRRYGRTFWLMPQVNVRPGTEFDITANILRHQAYVAMAYGAERLCWACWTPGASGGGWWDRNVLDENGEKTPSYHLLKEVNAEIHRIAQTFMRYRSVDSVLVGDCDADGKLAAKGIRRFDSFDDAFVTGLRAADNAPLVVGARVARDGNLASRAYFIVPAGDLVDEKKETHAIEFRCWRPVRVVGPDGPVPLTRLDGRRWRFSLADNHAAMIIL